MHGNVSVFGLMLVLLAGLLLHSVEVDGALATSLEDSDYVNCSSTEFVSRPYIIKLRLICKYSRRLPQAHSSWSLSAVATLNQVYISFQKYLHNNNE